MIVLCSAWDCSSELRTTQDLTSRFAFPGCDPQSLDMNWSGRRDLNSGPPAAKTGAKVRALSRLPTASANTSGSRRLHPHASFP